jgi:putative transposase
MPKTTNEIAAEYGVHPSQISQWKKQLLDELPQFFSEKEKDRGKTEAETETLISNLYQQIGQLKVEVDYLKKNQGDSLEIKRGMIEPEHPSLSIARQCELLGIAR